MLFRVFLKPQLQIRFGSYYDRIERLYDRGQDGF